MAILVLFTVILPYQITGAPLKSPPLLPIIIKLHEQQEQQIHEVEEKIVTVEEVIKLLAKSLVNFADKQYFSPELFKLQLMKIDKKKLWSGKFGPKKSSLGK